MAADARRGGDGGVTFAQSYCNVHQGFCKQTPHDRQTERSVTSAEFNAKATLKRTEGDALSKTINAKTDADVLTTVRRNNYALMGVGRPMASGGGKVKGCPGRQGHLADRDCIMQGVSAANRSYVRPAGWAKAMPVPSDVEQMFADWMRKTWIAAGAPSCGR
jgi:hypothetical protein